MKNGLTRLKLERTRRGLTQLELGAKARLFPSELSRIETGRGHPYPSQAKKLAKALGMPLEEAERLGEPVNDDSDSARDAEVVR